MSLVSMNVVSQGDSRLTVEGEVSFTADPATTPIISLAGFSRGTIQLATGQAAVTLVFHASAKRGSDTTRTLLSPAYSDAEPPVALSRTVSANKSYPIPEALFGAAEIAIVGDVAGVVKISLKG